MVRPEGESSAAVARPGRGGAAIMGTQKWRTENISTAATVWSAHCTPGHGYCSTAVLCCDYSAVVPVVLRVHCMPYRTTRLGHWPIHLTTAALLCVPNDVLATAFTTAFILKSHTLVLELEQHFCFLSVFFGAAISQSKIHDGLPLHASIAYRILHIRNKAKIFLKQWLNSLKKYLMRMKKYNCRVKCSVRKKLNLRYQTIIIPDNKIIQEHDTR